jgi:molybdopterin-binding protein
MDNQGPISFPLMSSGPMWNHVDGRVISILYGLTRTTVKVMSEDDVLFTVRCPSEKFEQVNVRIGQQVTAQINAHDISLRNGWNVVWKGAMEPMERPNRACRPWNFLSADHRQAPGKGVYPHECWTHHRTTLATGSLGACHNCDRP